METTTIEGHVSRALDFFNKSDIFYVISKESPWENELEPPQPDLYTKLESIIGFKKVNKVEMVVPDEDGLIDFRGNKWRAILAKESRYITVEAVEGNTELVLNSNIDLYEGNKIRVNKSEIYTVDEYNGSTYTVTVKEPLSHSYEENTLVEAGAIPEESRWVYLDADLNYDELPLVEFRQVGLVTSLIRNSGVPVAKDNLLPNEVYDYGILEAIDNRLAVSRQVDQRERLMLIIEF